MTTKFHVLIDADIIAYQASTLAEQLDPFDQTPRRDVSLADLVDAASSDIEELHGMFDDSEVMLVFSPSDRTNFRRKVDSTYKQNRNPKPKPRMYWELVRELKTNYNNLEISHLEGDDVLGILHTKNPKNSVICSSDKDLRTIPGHIYDFHHKQHHYLTPNQANHFWMYQTLMGDATDGYKGCPGIGKKKAADILPCIDQNEDEDVFLERLWFEVIQTYFDYYKNVDVALATALRQSRLARILRCSDYNFDRKSVRLWHPTEEINLPLNTK